VISFVVSLWQGKSNIAVVSTHDEKFLEKLKEWAKKDGWRLEVKRHQEIDEKSK